MSYPIFSRVKDWATGLFAKPAPPLMPSTNAPVSLTTQQTEDNWFTSIFSQFPDPDEVLSRARLHRADLKRLLTDDEIYQCVETRRDALQSSPPHVEPADNPYAPVIMAMLNPILSKLRGGLFSSLLYGYSVVEVVYKPYEFDHTIEEVCKLNKVPPPKYVLAWIGEVPLRYFEPLRDGTLIYRSPLSGMPVEVDTKYKFILTLNNPSFENPYGEALLSRAYWAWYFRFNGWNFFAKFLERAGIPLLVGKSTDTQRMGAALSRAHANSVIAVDRDDSVDLLSNGGANQGNAFDVFEAAVVRRIEKLILGQTLTSGTDGGSGNRALGDVHNDVRGDKKFADIEREKVGIQTLVKALCELNEYPILSVAYSGAVDLDADRAARDAILTEKLGVEFSDTYISSKYSLESDDFTRRTAATAPLPQAVQNEQ